MDKRVTELPVGEAKARFSELLARAENGETITIKRHGRAIAKIVAADSGDASPPSDRAEKLREFLRTRSTKGLLPGETYKDFIDEGRR
jgi:prevent-host-death family protein